MGVRASEFQAISVKKPAFGNGLPGVRSSLRHSGADSDLLPSLMECIRIQAASR